MQRHTCIMCVYAYISACMQCGIQRASTKGVMACVVCACMSQYVQKSNQNKFFNKIPAHNVINRKARDLHSLVVPLVHIPLKRNGARARQSASLSIAG